MPVLLPTWMESFELMWFCIFCLMFIELTDWIDKKWK
jgi:hypothetical protein